MFSYALVNRPAGLGCIPKGVAYTVSPRPNSGLPHHDMARHGILVTERELSPQEIKSFELAVIADEEMLGAIAEKIKDEMSEYANAYLRMHKDKPGHFKNTVLDRLSSVEECGVRYSICDVNQLVVHVEQELQAHLKAQV